MKKVKKLLSLILTVCMILSLLPVPAQAAGAPYTISTGTVYLTLSETLQKAADGATITLLEDITESVSYTVYADKTITIDGGGYTLTGTAATDAALALNGTGTVNLKNLTVQGGASSSGTSTGLDVSGSVSVQSYGTVSAKGGTVTSSRGVTNSGTGTVNVTTASAIGTQCGYGVANTGSGTVNVGTATGSSTGLTGAGVWNNAGGTVNVTEASSSNGDGVRNSNSGTVNVTRAVSTSDLFGCGVSNTGTGTVNAGTVTGSAVAGPAVHGVNNLSTGTVNAGTITGTTSSGTGIINTGTAVTVIPLHVGTNASCVLDSITIAAAGPTTIGTLPGVYKAGVYSNSWYTGSDLSNQFSMQEISSEATLYSSLYTPDKISAAAISGVTVPVTGATPVSSIADTTQYTTTISWSPASATFAAGTTYTATITISPKTGYTLTGVPANFFTVAGATTTNAADSGVVTTVFPATAATATKINTAAIAGVTTPVTGAAPASAIADTSEYTATISWSPAAAAFAAGTAYTATITISPKTGYTLTGVPANFFTVVGATTTNAADSGVITAVFPATAAASSGGGGGGGGNSSAKTPAAATSATSTTGSTITATATTGANGAATAAVTGAQVTSAVTQAVEKASSQGADTRAVVAINVSGAAAAKSVSTSIPQVAFNTLAGSSVDALTVTTSVGSVALDRTALSVVNQSASGDVVLTVVKEDTMVEGRPVYDLSITSGGQTISDFGGGTATVSVPYTLAPGEDAAKIVIYCRTSSGKLEIVPNCVYDPAAGKVTFKTAHFSTYEVGYNDVSFTDVSGWCKDYVNYLAAREIINGTSNGKFSPDANITRAEFVTILANLAGKDLSGSASSSFRDVKTADWYFKAVEWAYKNGITAGSGGMFDPNACITRQDMAVMITRYAKKGGYTLPQPNNAITFSDSDKIATYASDAVTAMQRAGIISGNGDGSFAPTANASRAQAAKMIAGLLQGMIK